MKLINITAKNFLTYEELDYSFVDKPLMVQGLNLTDDNQKSNGSGKSSIQAVVEFCLTGDNSRGVRDIELVRFGTDKSELSLLAQCDFRKEFIKIEWLIKKKGSNVLNISTKKYDSDEFTGVKFSNVNDGKKFILNWFAISKEDLFNYFVINMERFTSFFKSSNKKKVDLINRFSDASVIDNIEEIDTDDLHKRREELHKKYSENVGKLQVNNELLQAEQERDLSTEYENEIAEIKEENQDIEDEISEINDEITVEQENIKKILDSKPTIEAEIEALNAQKVLALQEYNLGKEGHLEIKKQLTEAQLLVDNFKKTDFSKKEQEFNNQIGSFNEEIKIKQNKIDGEIHGKIKKVQAIISNLEIVIGGKIICPHCKHEFIKESNKSVEQINSELKKANQVKDKLKEFSNNLENDIANLNEEIKVPKLKISEIFNKKEKENEEYLSLLNAVNFVNNNINKNSKKVNSLKDDYDSICRQIDGLKNSIENLGHNAKIHERKILDYNAEIERYKKDIEANVFKMSKITKSDNSKVILELSNKIGTLEKEQLKIEGEISLVDDEILKANQWKNNFKQFRMFIANKSLKTMESHCNRYLVGLGSDLRVVFNGYKVLANGTIKDEITAKVIRNQERTFNSFSKGEQCRLLFASILANRHMINSTHPYGGLDFLSIDEVFEGVDGLGLSTLVQEAKKLQTCIMIITHVTDEHINEDTIQVIKENNVSRIKYYESE